MEVVYVGLYNTSEVLTGPEKVSKRIFEEYAKINRTLFIHYFQDGKKYGYFKKLFGYEKTDELNGSEVLKLGIFRMLFQIAKLNPKIVHILCFNRFVIFLYVLKVFLRMKIFYTLNGIIRHENRYYNKESIITMFKNVIVENVIIYFSDRIFYLSEFSKNILYLYYSPDNSKLSKTMNGLDTCFLEQEIADLSNKEVNTIVFIGNIDQKEKGFDFLIRSLLKCNIKTKLFIIDFSDKLQRFKAYPNLEIIIVDKMSPINMIEFLGDKNIVVSTSEYDSFNISVLEAISCGLYPVLTKQTGVSEFIGEYVNVSLVDYGDEINLCQVLSNLLKAQKSIGRVLNLDELSWIRVFEKYYKCFY